MKNLEGLRLRKRSPNAFKDPWVYASGVALIGYICLVQYL